MDDPTCSSLGHRTSCGRFLRHNLGALPSHSCEAFQIALLDPTCLCHRSRSTSLVPNALGHFSCWTISSLGRLSRYLRNSWEVPLAMAGSSGCATRCRVWYDSLANNDKISYYIHPHRRPGAWLRGHNPRATHSARQHGARECVP